MSKQQYIPVSVLYHTGWLACHIALATLINYLPVPRIWANPWYLRNNNSENIKRKENVCLLRVIHQYTFKLILVKLTRNKSYRPAWSSEISAMFETKYFGYMVLLLPVDAHKFTRKALLNQMALKWENIFCCFHVFIVQRCKALPPHVYTFEGLIKSVKCFLYSSKTTTSTPHTLFL